MLSDHIAAGFDESFGVSGFIGGVEPGVQGFHINYGIGIYSLYAKGESVDAGAGFGQFGAVSGNITDFTGFGFHAGSDTGEETSLVDAAEIVVEVYIVGHVTGGMGEVDIGIFFCQFGSGFHVAIAGGEDDVAILSDAIFNGGADGVGIGVADVQNTEDLIIGEAEFFLHTNDALVMHVGIAGTIGGVTDMNNTDFDVFYRNTGRCGFVCSGFFIAAAGRESEYDHQSKKDNEKCFCLFHFFLQKKFLIFIRLYCPILQTSFLTEADLTGEGVHAVDNGHGFQMNTVFPQFFAAVLKTFFNGDGHTGQFRPGLFHNGHQTADGVAVGEKIIDDENNIVFIQIVFGNTDIVNTAMGKRFHRRGIYRSTEIFGLGFFREDHRAFQGLSHGKSNGDAAGFHRQDFGDAVRRKTPRNLLP